MPGLRGRGLSWQTPSYTPVAHSIQLTIGNFRQELVRNQDLNVAELENRYDVRIFRDKDGWYIRDVRNRELFSFDLPETIFNLYTQHGILTAQRALDLKSEYLRELQVFLVTGGIARVVKLELDQDWLSAIRERIRESRIK